MSQVSTDPERLTALVFLAIRDAETFPHIFYRDHCADMALDAAHIDPAFIAPCGALPHLGHAPVAGRPARRLRKGRRRGEGRGRARHPRHRLPPGALGPRPARRRGRALRRRPTRRPRASRPSCPDCALVVGTEEEIPHRRRLGRHARRTRAQSASATRALHRREARARSDASRSTARFPRASTKAALDPASGRGLQRARRGRRVHGGLPQRLAARRSRSSAAAARERLRRDRRLAPRLRAGDAHRGRARSTSSTAA